MEKKRRVGVYLSASVVLKNPEYVEVLRDEIGLNMALIGYSGKLAPEMVDRSPFDGLPVSDECLMALLARDLDGEPLGADEFDQARRSVGPSAGSGGDDQALRRAIEILRRAGVEVWIGLGSWTGSSLMYCPSKGAVNDWYEALYAHCATQYEVDGMDISHARYPKTSVPRGFQACTCDDCAREAAAMDYDMEEMKAALRQAVERVRTADAKLLAAVGRSGIGSFDLSQWLGLEDWFRFRADLLTSKLVGFHKAVHAAAGDDFVYGSDTYPTSQSLLVGQDHTAWAEFSDFASPLVSHITTFVSFAFLEWAPLLQAANPGLSEEDTLQLLYGVAGYDGLDLPGTLAEYEFDKPERLPHVLPLEELILHDLRKARLLLPPQLPSYPILHGHGWPRSTIDAILRGADAAGHDGVVWQGTDELVDFELK